jgi:hypothetical protein
MTRFKHFEIVSPQGTNVTHNCYAKVELHVFAQVEPTCDYRLLQIYGAPNNLTFRVSS